MWRAAVLIGVHLLAALHIAHWLRSGETMTPLEPSEGMQFALHGVVNAGLVFFGLMVLSTLVLGRWFCGWACHLVALQDLSRWLLLKARIRPKPLRSSTLALIPLIAFLYMFFYPAVERAMADRPTPTITTHFETDEFWATFPSWTPALLTFVTCGFFAVYFLGAKGFCTNGCPYGAIFGVADQFAPVRIRVTNDCEHCGHCTGVCTSNVRVHEEVARFGMVVDPGCMKCLDCIQVCPNDALYVGIGAPALAARAVAAPARGAAAGSHERTAGQSGASGATSGSPISAWRERLWRLAWAGVFSFCAMTVFRAYDLSFVLEPADWQAAGVLTAVTVVIVALLGGRSTRKDSYSRAEEIALGAVFLLGIYSFRGVYDLVGFLFALGLAAVFAFLVLQAARLLYVPNVSLHAWKLRLNRKLQPAGWMFLGVVAALVVVGANGALVNYHLHAAQAGVARLARAATATQGAASPTPNDGASHLAERIARHAERALSAAWLPLPQAVRCLAIAHHSAGSLDQYEADLQRLLAISPKDRVASVELAMHLMQTGRATEALAQLKELTRLHPRWSAGYVHLSQAHAALGQRDGAREALDAGLAIRPDDADLLMNRGIWEAQGGNLPAAEKYFRRSVMADPKRADTQVALGKALAGLQRTAEASAALRRALELQPDHAEAALYLGYYHADRGEWREAARYCQLAVDHAPDWPEAQTALAEALRHAEPAQERRPGTRGR